MGLRKLLSSAIYLLSSFVKKLSLFLSRVALLFLYLGISHLTAKADDVQMIIPPGHHAPKIGTRALADPSGATHTKQEVAGKVCVAIFSAPNMSQGDKQEKWSDLLANKPASKVSNSVVLILVEDMSQAGMFKDMALDSMKKHFTPKSRPFLILDQDGSVFKKFGVPSDKTEILIYDKNSTLRDVEVNLGEDDEDNTIHRIKVITRRLLAE